MNVVILQNSFKKNPLNLLQKVIVISSGGNFINIVLWLSFLSLNNTSQNTKNISRQLAFN